MAAVDQMHHRGVYIKVIQGYCYPSNHSKFEYIIIMATQASIAILKKFKVAVISGSNHGGFVFKEIQGHRYLSECTHLDRNVTGVLV